MSSTSDLECLFLPRPPSIPGLGCFAGGGGASRGSLLCAPIKNVMLLILIGAHQQLNYECSGDGEDEYFGKYE